MTDENKSTSVQASLSWSSPGNDPLDDIRFSIEKDKRETAAMLGCSIDELPGIYQAGFDALDRLVSGIVTEKKAHS